MKKHLLPNLAYLAEFNITPPTADCLSAVPIYQSPPTDCPTNPTDITNPYYEWIVRHDISPFDLCQIFDWDCQPFWAMGRMGQSTTILPDGRLIFIGGEYEDYYDPQFYIYHDVIVKSPNGDIQIFAYPKSIFAPTDFHSATLIHDDIYIIGNVGYKNTRCDDTPIYALNIHSFAITKIEPRNSMGQISHHTATIKDGQILIQGGQLMKDGLMFDNIDEWAFNPNTKTFKNLTNHTWQGFLVERKDLQWLSLFDYRLLLSAQSYDPKEFDERLLSLQDKIGIEPDIKMYQNLFIPPITHQQDKDDENTIWIDDIKVRYVDNFGHVAVYIEGQLSDEKVELLKDNLTYKLSKLENFPCQATLLPFHTPLGIHKRAKKIKKV